MKLHVNNNVMSNLEICMNETIMLRPATIQDADTLLDWRNDPATRKASHSTSRVGKEEHLAWLSEILNSNNRKLFVADENDAPVGTVRADFSEGAWELSWTVAPNARGRGVAKRMVALFAQQINEPIRAEIKTGNIASALIAESVGMVFIQEVEGVLHYRREAMKRT